MWCMTSVADITMFNLFTHSGLNAGATPLPLGAT